MLGTRGVPAHYGGFETAIEEIGRRLVERGHEVVVYCRDADDAVAGTISGWSWYTSRPRTASPSRPCPHGPLRLPPVGAGSPPGDAAFVFNAANAPFIPPLHARGVPVVVHVDGLEWQRDKWQGAGRRYYRGRGAGGAVGGRPDRRRAGHRRLLRGGVRRADRADHLRRSGPGRAGCCPPRRTRPAAPGLPPGGRPVRAREPRARDRQGFGRPRRATHWSSWVPRRTPTPTRRRSSGSPTRTPGCGCSVECGTRPSSTSCTPTPSRTCTATRSAARTPRSCERWELAPRCWPTTWCSTARRWATGAGSSTTRHPGRTAGRGREGTRVVGRPAGLRERARRTYDWDDVTAATRTCAPLAPRRDDPGKGHGAAPPAPSSTRRW